MPTPALPLWILPSLYRRKILLYYFAPSTILNALLRLSASFQTHPLVSTMGHKAQLSADVVTNVAFGLAGVILTTFMIWQAARYTASRNHYPRRRFCPPHPDHDSLANLGQHKMLRLPLNPWIWRNCHRLTLNLSQNLYNKADQPSPTALRLLHHRPPSSLLRPKTHGVLVQ